MPFFSVGIKFKKNYKGNELRQKLIKKTVRKLVNILLKKKMGKEQSSFPILSTAPTIERIF